MASMVSSYVKDAARNDHGVLGSIIDGGGEVTVGYFDGVAGA